METLFNSPGKFINQFGAVDGYKTHYFEAGREDADRLILVHGGPMEIGMDAYRWYPTVIPLSKHFHVYAIDELGSGGTDPPKDLKDLKNVKLRAEHVIRFIETLKLAPINIVGQSSGGWISTFITLTRPDLVKKLVLVDSGSTAASGLETGTADPDYIDVNGKKFKPVGDGQLPYFKNVFEPGTMKYKKGLATTREGLRKVFGTYVYDQSMVTEELLDHLESLSKKWYKVYESAMGDEYWSKTNIREYTQKQYYIGGEHIRDLVKNIKTPTLLVWGRNSNKGIDPGVALYKRIPDAQMHIFDKASHFLWLDQPEDFNSLVTWFLTKDK